MSDYPQSQTTPGADRQSQTLLATAEAERDRYQLLLDINNAAVTQLGLGNVLRATSESLRKVIPHDSAAITLYDPKTSQLRLQSFDLQYASDVEEGALFPLEGTPEGLAFTSRQPVLIRHLDLKEFPAPQTRHAYNDGLRSGCIIPLIAHDRTLGTLDIASRRESAFTEKDAELLTHIAKQIAIAVENARLTERQRRFAQELEDKVARATQRLREIDQAVRRDRPGADGVHQDVVVVTGVEGAVQDEAIRMALLHCRIALGGVETVLVEIREIGRLQNRHVVIASHEQIFEHRLGIIFFKLLFFPLLRWRTKV